ncbi:hypothetical protein, partial [Roseiconus lacunae]|uniref:hypothetical protein n=1 Tax=Roseiconus lacunae TaxID=2605694 RepID=UPI001E65423C
HVASGTSPTIGYAFCSIAASSKWRPIAATKFPEEPFFHYRVSFVDFFQITSVFQLAKKD